jgi:hypothetical protein
VWNHQHRRLVRFWSASAGLEVGVIDALRARTLEHLDLVEPELDALVAQLQEELTFSRRHLRDLLEHYWDRGWRRTHQGYDASPEDHLWRAATAVSDMQDALDELST